MTLPTTERRLTKRWFKAVQLSSTFLNTGTTNETFQQFSKQDSFRQMLKSSASIYESSCSQCFRTTTGIQSGQDVFDKSRLLMTFLINLGNYRNIILFQISPRRENG